MHNEVVVWEWLYATHMTDDIMILTHFTHIFCRNSYSLSSLPKIYHIMILNTGQALCKWRAFQTTCWDKENWQSNFPYAVQARYFIKKSDACSRKERKANSTVKSLGKYTINLSASSTFYIFYHQVLDNSATSKTHLQKYCQVLNRTDS